MKILKIYFLFLIILLSGYEIQAKTDYCSDYYKNNNISAFKIKDTYALDKNNIFVICHAGLSSLSAPENILASGNGGKSWQVRWTSSKVYLTKLNFLDEKIGFAVGGDYRNKKESGLILKTNDGGSTWKQIPIKISALIEDIQFINRSEGFAISENGSLLKSTNGGESWQINETDIKPDAFHIDFSNKNTGWVLTLEKRFNEVRQDEIRDGNIYNTQNGGKTWISQRERFLALLKQWNPTEIRFQKVKFFDSKNGYIAADFKQIEKKPNDTESYVNYEGAAIFSTKNGGETWETNIVTTDLGLKDAYFGSSGNFWVIPTRVWQEEIIYSSNNFGELWNQHSTKFTEGETPSRIYFLNDKTGFLITDLGSGSDNIYRTLDGGETWEMR